MTSSVVSSRAWRRNATRMGYRRSAGARCRAWLVDLLPSRARYLSRLGWSARRSQRSTPQPIRVARRSRAERIAVGVVATSPCRSHVRRVRSVDSSGVSRRSRSDRPGPSSTAASRFIVSRPAPRRAATTIRSRTVTPGRTTLSAASFSHASCQSSRGRSCSRARSSSQRAKRSRSSGPALRYPRWSWTARKWSVRVCARRP